MEQLRGDTRVIQENCDILILSASYGGGHNQVARALTKSLQQQVPTLRVLTVDYCELLMPLINRLSRFGYMQSLRHFPAGYGIYYQATEKIASNSFWQRRLNRFGYEELILLLCRLKPKMIIAAFPLPAGVLSEMKESGELDVPVVTVITDYSVHNQWLHPHTDLYLVGSTEMREGLVARGITPDKVVVTGIPILPEFNEVYDPVEVKREYGLEPEDRLLLFMGGSDGLFGGIRLSAILKELPSDAKILVICGTNRELYEKLQVVNCKHANLLLVKEVNNMAALMEVAELLVTKAGGITISEAMAKWLPMVIYKPNPGQEEANANYLWRHRAAIIAKSERRLKTVILRILNDRNFKMRCRRRCGCLGKSNAAAEGAELILKLADRKGCWDEQNRVEHETPRF